MITMQGFVLLFSFLEMFSDMGFIIKLFLLVAILGFLNQHIENKILKVIVALFMGYVMLIVNWATFGTMFVIYSMLGMGISSMFVDYFFMNQGHSGEELQTAGKNLNNAQSEHYNKSQGLPADYGLAEENQMEQQLEQMRDQRQQNISQQQPQKKGWF